MQYFAVRVLKTISDDCIDLSFIAMQRTKKRKRILACCDLLLARAFSKDEERKRLQPDYTCGGIANCDIIGLIASRSASYIGVFDHD